jgi:hypothetical protein
MDLGDVPDRWQAWWDTNQVTCIKYSRIEKTLEKKYDPEHVNLLVNDLKHEDSGHDHPFEQYGIVVHGRIEMFIGDERKMKPILSRPA